jgi:hypothetical protein
VIHYPQSESCINLGYKQYSDQTQDANENIMLDKEKSTQWIDPIAALINAHVRAMVFQKTPDLNTHIMDREFSF